jgi:hypothetical protein
MGARDPTLTDFALAILAALKNGQSGAESDTETKN